MKIFLYVRLHLKTIPWKFRIPNPKNYLVIYPQSFRNVCLQTYRNNRIRQKVAYFLRKIQTLRVNNSRILRIKNAKFQSFVFIWIKTYVEIFKSAFVCLSYSTWSAVKAQKQPPKVFVKKMFLKLSQISPENNYVFPEYTGNFLWNLQKF